MDFMLPQVDWTRADTLPDMTGEGHLAIDLETKDEGITSRVGPAWWRKGGFVTGVTITSSQRSIYAPVRHPDSECFDHDAVGRWLKHHILRPRTPTARKFFHNAPYDLGWAHAEWGIPIAEDIDDTMAMAFILDENQYAYGLDSVCRRLEVPGKDETALKIAAEAYGFDPKADMWRLPAKYVAPYAEQDGTSTLQVGLKMIGMMEAEEVTEAYQLEADLVPATVHMIQRGVRVDTRRVEETMDRFYKRRDEFLGRLEDHIQIGRRIVVDDLRSPKFMADVFSRLGIPIPKTAKGNDSFSNEWMSRFEGHPAPALCAQALQFHDAAEKFLGQYIMGFCHKGRIHAQVHSYKDREDEDDDFGGGTVTTRFSYSDPPLQQMPSRHPELAFFIRHCFLPESGEVWAAIDYSQQEYRLMVHYASATNMVGADVAVAMYIDDPDTDFHNMVVELTGLPRRKAKDCNFAKAFGAGIPKFAAMTGMTLEDAKKAMDLYDEKVPFIKRLAEFCQQRADLKGYIRMIDGARGRFPDYEPRWLDWNKVKVKLDSLRAQGKPMPKLNPCSLGEAQRRKNDPDHPWYGERLKRAKTHKAMNKLIQGSAARQMKKAMVAAFREGFIPLIQMHDELDLSVRTAEEAHRVGQIMADIVKLRVPVKTDVEFGSTWGRAAKNEQTGHKPTWEAALEDMREAA